MDKRIIQQPNHACAAAVTLFGLWATLSPSQAWVQTTRPAAMVVYPLIRVDAANDTIVELTNTNGSSPIGVLCTYLNGMGQCDTDSNVACLDSRVCPGGGQCQFGAPVPYFWFIMTPNQSLGWSAHQGLQLLPCSPPLQPGECSGTPSEGTIIPVPSTPFQGELRCTELDPATLAPVARNDLSGVATVVGPGPPPAVSSYAAIGIESLGVNDGNAVLCLGSDATTCPIAEYSACPAVESATHFFLGTPTALRGSFILTPCALDPGTVPTPRLAQLLVFDEFELRLSLQFMFTYWKRLELEGASPLFDIGTRGTLTGQTRIHVINADPANPIEEPVLGLVVENRRTDNGGQYDETLHDMATQGVSATAAIVRLPDFSR